MEREFVVKVILSRDAVETPGDAYIPLVIKAPTAEAALNSFAQRSNAQIVGSLVVNGDLAARGIVGAGEKMFPVIVAARA
jgi:hypothetical protein